MSMWKPLGVCNEAGIPKKCKNTRIRFCAYMAADMDSSAILGCAPFISDCSFGLMTFVICMLRGRRKGEKRLGETGPIISPVRISA